MTSDWTAYVEATTPTPELFFLQRDGSDWVSSGGNMLRPDGQGGWET